ncbi:MAG TPA: helix-turn-helix domain-containing protein [Solirubrobacterales bacterium]|nr:helix-turn-helix domain-containing protein [Solirubrobacterales bacterium]
MNTVADAVRVTTLRGLHEALGPEVFEVVAAPDGVDAPLRDVLFNDRLDPDREDLGDKLVLAVGSAPGEEGELIAALGECGAGGAAALAARVGDAPSTELIETAEQAGLALISLSPQLSWGEFFELVRATLSAPDLEAERSPVSSRDLAGSDLFAVAEATAALAGGPVVIDDIRSRVLAFSAGGDTDDERRFTILNRRPPDDCMRAMRQEGVIDHLLTNDEVLRFEYGEGSQPRRAIAIRHNGQMLGSIWLMGDEGALADDADEVLRRAAPIAALHLVRQRMRDDIERRMRGDALATMLNGGEPSEAALRRLDLPGDEPLVVLAIEVITCGVHSPAAVGTRLIDLLTMQLHAYDRPAVAATLDGRVYAVTSSRGPRDREALQAIARECRIHASKVLRVELRTGIGHEVAAAAELAVARRSADECLSLSPDSEREVLFEAIHGTVLLANVEGMVGGWYGGQSAALRKLIEHDRLHSSDYLPTLRAVLDNLGNAAKAAQDLHLHVNTVRYRIRRITELTGIDLADGDARLPLEIELRAYAKAAGA